MNDRDAVLEALRGITASWRSRRFEDLESYLRPDVIYIAPGFAARLDGRDACIASYRDFLDAATVHEYIESDAVVDLFGDSAVATYRYDIDYSLGGDRYRESGRDVFVFTRVEKGWRAAWRILVPEPAGP